MSAADNVKLKRRRLASDLDQEKKRKGSVMQAPRPKSGSDVLNLDGEPGAEACWEVVELGSSTTSAAKANAGASSEEPLRQLRWRMLPEEPGSSRAFDLTFRIAVAANGVGGRVASR